MATRLGATASGLRKPEQAKAADSITLATLRRAAAAMDCELQYVLVPRRPLRDMRWQQALSLARRFQQRADRTMALEAQELQPPATVGDERLNELAEELLRSRRTRLWD